MRHLEEASPFQKLVAPHSSGPSSFFLNSFACYCLPCSFVRYQDMLVNTTGREALSYIAISLIIWCVYIYIYINFYHISEKCDTNVTTKQQP